MLKITKTGVVLTKVKPPKIGAQAPQYNINCDDMRKVQTALLFKPPVPFFKRTFV